MAEKKVENLAKLPFGDLKDKAKEIEGFKTMNRFELTMAVKKQQGLKVCDCPAEANPRIVKVKMAPVKAKKHSFNKQGKLDEKTKTFKASLRKHLSRLKKATRRAMA